MNLAPVLTVLVVAATLALPAATEARGHGAHRHRDGSHAVATRTDIPTARCRDGSDSYSRHRRGTCSHHGGVAVWLR
ncbi:DUF3761 domain-containing protein [Paludibacterium paludis]|uniref:DUF3761 domain-containing protein n=1 Tax=Paludibacterium paludis TaxID=1225769 RepID=UPI001C042021|nr:DUF3761 domain-containing protein [Paludibacterium paludis]